MKFKVMMATGVCLVVVATAWVLWFRPPTFVKLRKLTKLSDLRRGDRLEGLHSTFSFSDVSGTHRETSSEKCWIEVTQVEERPEVGKNCYTVHMRTSFSDDVQSLTTIGHNSNRRPGVSVCSETQMIETASDYAGPEPRRQTSLALGSRLEIQSLKSELNGLYTGYGDICDFAK
jgi:hypothetical protein